LNEGPSEDDPAAWQEQSVAALENLKESAPGAVQPAVIALADGLIGPISANDEEAYFAFADSEAFQTANTTIDEFLTSQCGWPVTDVTATEYQFGGDLDGLEAGRVGFSFENSGTEAHHMVLFRINDDVTQTMEELFELPDEEIEGMVQDVGYAQALPGQSDTSFMDLTEGRYGMVCFLPVGATTWEEANTSDGPPHFTQGMFREFTVGA
jgi:hypothetical protein